MIIRPVLVCALAASSSAVAAQPVGDSIHLQIDDRRPPIERRSEIGSVWIWSCDYAISRVGEVSIPYAIPDLTGALERTLGDGLRGRRIALEHYTLMVNGSAIETGRSVGFGVGGAVGSSIARNTRTAHAKCSKAKTKFGWFDASELTNSHSPFIGEATLRVDEKPVQVRVVFSPEVEASEGATIEGFLLTSADKKSGMAAIAKLNAAIVEAVANVLGVAPASGPAQL